jgi:hypothetical protein
LDYKKKLKQYSAEHISASTFLKEVIPSRHFSVHLPVLFKLTTWQCPALENRTEVSFILADRISAADNKYVQFSPLRKMQIPEKCTPEIAYRRTEVIPIFSYI